MKQVRSRQIRRSHNRLKCIVAAGAAFGGFSLGRYSASGSTFTWSTPANGNWSVPQDWVEGSAPVSANTTQLIFTPGSYTANNDLGNLTVNSITINNSPADTTDQISVGGFNTITFDGSNPAISLTGGNATVTSNIASTGGMQITNSGEGTLLLNGQSFVGTTTFVNSGAGNITLGDSYNFGPVYYGSNVLINLENTGTGTLDIGNTGPSAGFVNSGISGTINVSAGAVTFAGSTSGDLFGNTLVLNVASGASFNFANNGETFGGLTGAGNVILGTAGLSFVEPGNRIYTGNMSGTGGISQSVSSVLTLGGISNSYSGVTTITNNGAIQTAGANSLSPNSVVNIINGVLDLGGFSETVAGLSGGNNLGQPLALDAGTLTINPVSGASYNFYSGVSGSVNVIIGGPGTESLLGANSYTGATNVNSGSLRLNAVGLATSGITLASGTTLYAGYAGNGSWTTPITGTGAFVKEGAGTATFSTGTALTPSSVSISAGTIVLDQTTDNTPKLGSSSTETLGFNGGSLTLLGNSGAPSVQAFGITKVGTTLGGSAEVAVTTGAGQTATLAFGAFSRTTGTTIDFSTTNPNGGSAVISASTGAPDNTVYGFATFNQNDWATTVGGNVVPMNTYSAAFGTGSNTSISSTTNISTIAVNSLRFAAPAAVTFTASTNTLTLNTGGILVPASVTGATSIGASGDAGKLTSATGEIVFNDYGPGTMTDYAIIGGANSVTKAGAGTLVMASANTYTGTTYIDGGVLQVSATTGLGASPSPVVINGGTLSIQNGSLGTINGSGGMVHPITVGPAGATFNFGTNQSFLGNGLSGTGTVTKQGLAQWAIGTNASNFSGGVIAQAGIVRFTSSDFKLVTGFTVASGAQYLIDDDATATFGFAAGAVMNLAGVGPATSSSTTPGAFALEDQSPTGSVPGGPHETFSNPIVLTGDTTFGIFNATDNNATGAVGRISQLTLNSAVSGPGNLTKVGSGILILANASDTYGGGAGTTVLAAGTLQAGVNNALSTTSTLQFGQSGSTAAGTFDLAGFNQTLAGLTVNASTGHQIINSSATTGSILTLNYNGTTAQPFTGQIGGVSTSTSNISLVKSGTGTTSLLGSTTYTGSATVAAGALRVTGSSVSRAYAVNDGATLIVTNTDGTTLPATTLTLGNSGTTNLDFEFNAAQPTSGAIGVSASNGLTLNGTVNVAISSISSLTTGQFPLITYVGSLQGAGFAAFNPTVTLPSRVIGSLVKDTANSSIDLDVTGVDFLKWDGATSNNWEINRTADFKLNSSGAATTYLDLPSPDTVFFDDSATGSRNVNLTTTLSPAAVTINNSNGDYTFSGPGLIAGPSGLLKTGTGTLNILTNNTNTGQTTINAGTIVVGNGGTTGSLGAGAVTDNGSLVVNRADDITFSSPISGSGSLTKSGSNTLTLTSAVNLGGNVSIAGGTLSANNGGTILGDITGPGSLNVAFGTLQIGNGGTTGTVQTNVALASNGTLAFNRSDSTTFSGSLTGTGNLAGNGGSIKLTGSVNYSGITTIAGTSLEFGSDTNTTLANNLFGNGTLIKSGAGTLTLLYPNSNYLGNVTVNAGVLQLADPNGTRGGLNSPSILINPNGHFIFGLGGISGENPDLGGNVLVTVNGGIYETRVGEEWGGLSLQNGGTFLFSVGVGATFTAPDGTGAFAGLDLQSGTVASNVSTGSAAITSSVSAAGVTKSTAGTVNFTGPITFNAATPIFINQGLLSFQTAAVPVAGTAALTIGSANTSGTFQLSDGGIAAMTTRPVMIGSAGGTIDIPVVNGSSGSLSIGGGLSGAGTLTKTGGGILILTGYNTATGTNVNFTGTTNISAGTLALSSTAFLPNSPLVLVGPGATLQLNASMSNGTTGILNRPLGSVNVGMGGLVQVSPATLHANRQLFVPTSLSLSGATGSWTSKADLGNNDLDLAGATLSVVTDQLRQGFANGNWNGSGGIASISAANDPTHLTALGVIRNTADGITPLFGAGTGLGQFDGTSPAVTDVLVKYTYYGDANLDGKVDGSDYSLIDNGYLSGATGWFNGDFNYDGVVDGSDYTLIDNAFNTQGASLSATIANPSAVATAQIASPSGSSSVPEPAFLGVIGLGALGLLGRRKRI